MDDLYDLANHRLGEGGVHAIADFDWLAPFVREAEYRTIDSGAVFTGTVMTDDGCRNAADGMAQERQIVAKHQRKRGPRQCKANPEEEGFDQVGLARIFCTVKVVAAGYFCG